MNAPRAPEGHPVYLWVLREFGRPFVQMVDPVRKRIDAMHDIFVGRIGHPERIDAANEAEA